MSSKFWTEDLCALFSTFQIFPSATESTPEKLNALTRLAILISLVLFVLGVDWWLYFLLVSVLVIIVIYYGSGPSRNHESDRDSGYLHSAGHGIREGFARVPRYEDPFYSTTTVAPVFSEEWSLQEPEFSLIENAPTYSDDFSDLGFEEPENSSSYPYGQYLTRTNLMPSDEKVTHSLNGGQTQARSYANSAFLRHDLAHRENLTSSYKRTLARRFRHSSGGVYTPYAKY